MTFNAREYSLEDGQPIYLYRFSLNDRVWRYTSTDGDVVRGADTWEALPISDDGPRQSGEPVQDALKITASTNTVPAQIYLDYPPARPMQVAIFATHEDDTEITCIYVGEITQFDNSQIGTCTFTCETLSSTMQREGLRLGWQRNCPYALYDPVTCKVDKTAYAVTLTVTEIEGNLVMVPGLAAASARWFAGGFVEWLDVVRGLERRGIEQHTGDQITMFGTADGIAVGTTLVLYPGCTRTTDSCATFNNLPNYGGVPALQGSSPFDGNPVFY